MSMIIMMDIIISGIIFIISTTICVVNPLVAALFRQAKTSRPNLDNAILEMMLIRQTHFVAK